MSAAMRRRRSRATSGSLPAGHAQVAQNGSRALMLRSSGSSPGATGRKRQRAATSLSTDRNHGKLSASVPSKSKITSR
jgi:hypothetical protein